MRPRSRRLTCAGLALAALALPACAAASSAPAEGQPHLVLMLVIDRLRPERLDAGLPGGLGRLAREGRLFVDGVHDHAHTDTCPGHAVILTGRRPAALGVPGNQFVDRETGEVVYCVQDDGDNGRVLGGSVGRSPRLLRGTALGDWLKAARPETRVFAVSAKDRGAIPLGGQHPDAAYWLERNGAIGFTTSRYYREQLPAWVQRFNGALPGEPGFLSGLPERWEHPSGSPSNGARRDDFPGESARFGRTSGHPVADASPARAQLQLTYTPYLDDVTLEFARRLIREEGLGRGPHADLLALSLSASDFIGHLYGPESQEARDALLHLDRSLGDFLDLLDAEIGAGRVLIAMTSDHGILSLPEWLVESGSSRCPVPGGRADLQAILAELEGVLRSELDPPSAEPGRWTSMASLRLTLSRRRARELGVPLERAVAVARAHLERVPGIERVWTADEIAAAPETDPLARLYRNSQDPERSGDLELQPVATCLLTVYREGTNHGTPYLYDRAAPILFRGPGVDPGRVRGRAATVDIGPTLAHALGVETPPDLDGRPLPLHDQ